MFEQRPHARASRFSQVARICPFLGVDGAALATAAGATLTALFAAVPAWTRLGVYAPAFGALRKRRVRR